MWFINYANDCVVGLEFWFKTCTFHNSHRFYTADPSFRNCFLKRHDPGVLRSEEPHGQVCGTKDMVCVLPTQP